MPLSKRVAAECLGTFWLVFGGCGAAILAGKFIGILGVALAFGLTVLTMAYAIGHISGCHLNPAVSIGLFLGGRFEQKDLVPYIVGQVVGAVIAAVLLYVVAGSTMNGDFEATHKTFAANGFGDHSPDNYKLVGALIIEVLMTFMFLMIILGATDDRAPASLAPVAIGLGLTLIHLISIPVTNTSVNPARSTGPALFVGGAALKQLWLFWIAPIAGAALAGLTYKKLGSAD